MPHLFSCSRSFSFSIISYVLWMINIKIDLVLLDFTKGFGKVPHRRLLIITKFLYVMARETAKDN